jgi:hypothetical protein
LRPVFPQKTGPKILAPERGHQHPADWSLYD